MSSTTLPRSPARLAGLPYWSVSVKAGALTSSGAALPSIAWAMIGSALRLAWASAIGAAPTTMIATAQVVTIARVPAAPNARHRVGRGPRWARSRRPGVLAAAARRPRPSRRRLSGAADPSRPDLPRRAAAAARARGQARVSAR